MKRVFISHPFAANPYLNIKRINRICSSMIYHFNDVLPISPLHLFGYFDEGKPEYREHIMSVCKDLIMNCDEVKFYKYGELSAGQKQELNWCKLQNVKYEIINQ